MFFLRLYHLGLIHAEIGSIVPLGRGYFLHDSRHFVPGYYRAVPPGQKPFAIRIILALKPYPPGIEQAGTACLHVSKNVCYDPGPHLISQVSAAHVDCVAHLL